MKMRNWLAVSLWCGIACALYAQQPVAPPPRPAYEAPANAEVLKLLRAGMPESVVLYKIHAITGRFDTSADALIALKQAGATIQTKSIDTDVEKRDNHLRSSDFFDAEKYPTITFESTGVDAQTLTGKFTMHGVTKEISLPYTIKGPIKDPMGNVHLALQAKTKLNRKDYGVSWNKTLDAGGLMLGEEVNIEINGAFVKQTAEKK